MDPYDQVDYELIISKEKLSKFKFAIIRTDTNSP